MVGHVERFVDYLDEQNLRTRDVKDDSVEPLETTRGMAALPRDGGHTTSDQTTAYEERTLSMEASTCRAVATSKFVVAFSGGAAVEHSD